jgi:hypothetical protein
LIKESELAGRAAMMAVLAFDPLAVRWWRWVLGTFLIKA